MYGPVMLDVVGTELTEADIARLTHPSTGGVILFARNFTSREQVTELVNAIHRLAKSTTAHCGRSRGWQGAALP